MSRGVLAGASTENHTVTSNPGSAASATVGSSGVVGERLVEVTAIALSRPAFTNGRHEGMLSNITVTWPATMSVSAGALPL